MILAISIYNLFFLINNDPSYSTLGIFSYFMLLIISGGAFILSIRSCRRLYSNYVKGVSGEDNILKHLLCQSFSVIMAFYSCALFLQNAELVGRYNLSQEQALCTNNFSGYQGRDACANFKANKKEDTKLLNRLLLRST
ncbi:hypothetical protein HHA02_00840 [Cobetia marina]|nr:hypothetical protein HHA02_00840 [Cobetia marina]